MCWTLLKLKKKSLCERQRQKNKKSNYMLGENIKDTLDKGLLSKYKRNAKNSRIRKQMKQ